MDDTFFRAMLFDFYGELLTDKQREYYDLHYNEDYSLGEISEQKKITRQGVWDIIRRAENIMRLTEEKTGLIRRFEELRAEVAEIEGLVDRLREKSSGESAQLADKVLDKLHSLKY